MRSCDTKDRVGGHPVPDPEDSVAVRGVADSLNEGTWRADTNLLEEAV